MRRPVKGSYGRCPKCGSTDVGFDKAIVFKVDEGDEPYGPGLATCRECKAIWEGFDDAHVWDDDDPLCPFRKPCNNCAFRKGSPERSDPDKWAAIMENVAEHGGFYCHKGVPIEPGAEHGFAYPQRNQSIEFDGRTVDVQLTDRDKLRYCRGWLNVAFSKKNMARFSSDD